MAPILKPSRLDRAVAQHAKRTAKAKQKQADERRARLAWDLTRRVIYNRDKARCRAFGKLVMLTSSNPLDLAHVHHVVFRSAGGSDEFSNLVLLSARAHEMVHRHELDIEGDAEGLLTFRQRDLETGRIVREWEG